jgi:hypothetical protein
MKKLLFILPCAALLCGCQFYKPGQISKSVFGGLANDDAILSVPTPYGRAIRVGGSATNGVVVHPDGTVIRLPACKHEAQKGEAQTPVEVKDAMRGNSVMRFTPGIYDNFGNFTPIH